MVRKVTSARGGGGGVENDDDSTNEQGTVIHKQKINC